MRIYALNGIHVQASLILWISRASQREKKANWRRRRKKIRRYTGGKPSLRGLINQTFPAELKGWGARTALAIGSVGYYNRRWLSARVIYELFMYKTRLSAASSRCERAWLHSYQSAKRASHAPPLSLSLSLFYSRIHKIHTLYTWALILISSRWAKWKSQIKDGEKKRWI